jgi:hypothetical protein
LTPLTPDIAGRDSPFHQAEPLPPPYLDLSVTFICSTVSWSTPASFDFCFEGVPPNSLVAVSAVGVNLEEPAQHKRFMAGFREMVERLTPTAVLAYGNLPDEAHKHAHVVVYATGWQRIHASERIKSIEFTQPRLGKIDA